jgi:hypothetical protein
MVRFLHTFSSVEYDQEALLVLLPSRLARIHAQCRRKEIASLGPIMARRDGDFQTAKFHRNSRRR